MATKDGNSTDTVKIGYEPVLSYNLGVIEDVGTFIMDSPGSGTLDTSDAVTEGYDLPSGGADLVIRCSQPIKSAAAMVVTITGTDQDDGALTGTATIAAYAPRDQSYDVVPGVAGKKFKTVTAVQATNGIAGDGFDICVLPAAANDVEIEFVGSLDPAKGTTVKAIYDRYTYKHSKRLRAENKLSIQGFYVNNLTGLNRIDDRECTLRMDIHEDGGNAVQETTYWEKCRLGVQTSKSADGASELAVKAEGTYGRAFIFS